MKINKPLSAAVLCFTFFFGLLLTSSYAVDTSGGLSGLADKASSVAAGGDGAAPIDINSASTEILASIPGIGPQLGQAITAYRDANGSFSGINDLLKVDGIDAGLLETIQPFLKF